MKWISVNDRLPENTMDVWVYDGFYNTQFHAWYKGNTWRKDHKKWWVRDSNHESIGYFTDLKNAIAAKKASETKKRKI